MTRICATCPVCGEVELDPTDIVLHRVLDGDGELVAGSCYRFSCPECALYVEKPADAKIAALLTTGGVPVEDAPEPTAAAAVTGHPEAPEPGPPLTLDDLLDLHLALEAPDWLDRLVAAGR
jgi:hypothetical protein